MLVYCHGNCKVSVYFCAFFCHLPYCICLFKQLLSFPPRPAGVLSSSRHSATTWSSPACTPVPIPLIILYIKYWPIFSLNSRLELTILTDTLFFLSARHFSLYFFNPLWNKNDQSINQSVAWGSKINTWVIGWQRKQMHKLTNHWSVFLAFKQKFETVPHHPHLQSHFPF